VAIRGIRGATTATQDDPEAILEATTQLLLAICKANPTLRSEDIASAIFTLSDDLKSVYPAKAAREIGWTAIPLMCAQEISVPGGLSKCIRVLLHWNTPLSQAEIKHIYLREAVQLRPDLTPNHKL
jgi:chorismate mutase